MASRRDHSTAQPGCASSDSRQPGGSGAALFEGEPPLDASFTQTPPSSVGANGGGLRAAAQMLPAFGQRTGVGLYMIVVVRSGTEPSMMSFSCQTSVAASRLSSSSDSEKYAHMSTTVPGPFAGLNLVGRGVSPGAAAGCLGDIAPKMPFAMYQKTTTAQCMGTGHVSRLRLAGTRAVHLAIASGVMRWEINVLRSMLDIIELPAPCCCAPSPSAAAAC